jgi:hypothetical protein
MTTTTSMSGAVPCAPAGADCGCGCGGGHDCSDPVGLERTRFYPRQLIGPDELTQDQVWIRDKARRHNRLLHGWGVVCGCDVRPAVDRDGRPEPWTVIVGPGDVLGPYGDEIVVDRETPFDVRGASTSGFDCPPPADPWCADVRVERRPRQTLYLAIRYDECLTRPERTLGGCGCGCDDHECEYSRIRETFSLAVLEELPEAYRRAAEEDPKLAGGLLGALRCSPDFRGSVRPCPPCPTDPWVILADVVADAEGRLSIDAVTHRRYVASFGAFWFSCGAPASSPGAGAWTPAQRALLAERLDASAIRTLEERHGGDLSAVAEAGATAIKGVGRRSALARFLGARSIADVASADRPGFLASAAEAGVDAKRAGEVWDAASGVASTIRG